MYGVMPTTQQMHETLRLPFEGAADADGHILDAPDLGEEDPEPTYRDRARQRIFRGARRPGRHASWNEPWARVPRARMSARSPTTASRAAIPTMTWCSPPPRTWACRSPSIRPLSRSGPKAPVWGRGRT